MNDKRDLFNEWSSRYDESVKKSDKENTYPFAGYSIIKNKIFKLIMNKTNSKILEMGIGTGEMTHRLYLEGFEITGVDSSKSMIELSIKRMPYVKYVNTPPLN